MCYNKLHQDLWIKRQDPEKTTITQTRPCNIQQYFTAEAVLTSTHNLCFRAKIRKKVYHCKPQFYYIKLGVKGCLLHGLVFVMV